MPLTSTRTPSLSLGRIRRKSASTGSSPRLPIVCALRRGANMPGSTISYHRSGSREAQVIQKACCKRGLRLPFCTLHGPGFRWPARGNGTVLAANASLRMMTAQPKDPVPLPSAACPPCTPRCGKCTDNCKSLIGRSLCHIRPLVCGNSFGQEPEIVARERPENVFVEPQECLRASEGVLESLRRLAASAGRRLSGTSRCTGAQARWNRQSHLDQAWPVRRWRE